MAVKLIHSYLRVKRVQGTKRNQNMSAHIPVAKAEAATSANGGRHT
jgi:hypothetical protein